MKPACMAIAPMSNSRASTAKFWVVLLTKGLDSKRAIKGTEIDGLLFSSAAA